MSHFSDAAAFLLLGVLYIAVTGWLVRSTRSVRAARAIPDNRPKPYPPVSAAQVPASDFRPEYLGNREPDVLSEGRARGSR